MTKILLPASAAAALLLSSPALAVSRPCSYGLSNAESAIGSGEADLVPAWGEAPVPGGDVERALRLHKQLEGLLNRASGGIQKCSQDEKQGEEVQAVYARWKTLHAYFVKLTDNINAGNASATQGKDKMRAFQQATQGDVKTVAKDFAPMLEDPKYVPSGYSSPPARLELARTSLQKLQELCTGEFAGLQDIENVSFQMDVYPTAWCQLAAQREALVARVATASVSQNLDLWVRGIDEDAQALERKEGFSGLMGVMYELVHETKSATAKLSEQYQAQFKAAGAERPADLFGPAQGAVDRWWVEAKRLAPTWKFPANLVKDGAVEGRMKSALARSMPKAKVLKAGLLYPEWKIYKNGLGIPTDRVRTGVVLYSSPDYQGLCVQREWTVKDTWVGGGKWDATSSMTLGSIRLQKCQ
jgi:hypothetical protein